MKEIKFRAWDKKHKRMIIPVKQIIFENEICPILGFKRKPMIDTSLFEDCDLMQYICRKDKNKKNIYEGDIVRHKRYYESPCNYNFDPIYEDYSLIKIGVCNLIPSRGAVFKGYRKYINEITGEEEEFFPWEDTLTCIEIYAEIIGNIYENPNLLKKIINEQR